MSALKTHSFTGHLEGILIPSPSFPFHHSARFFAVKGKAAASARPAMPPGQNLTGPRNPGFMKRDSQLILKEVI
jgi:hypothetical protein